MDYLLHGMSDYLSRVHINQEHVEEAFDAFAIDVQAEIKSGVPHKNRQLDDQCWSDFIEGFEAKLEALDDYIKWREM